MRFFVLLIPGLLWSTHCFVLPNLDGVARGRSDRVALDDAATDGRAETTTTADARSASFEDAQMIGRKLATVLNDSCANGEPMPEEATSLLRALVSTTSGARGWFVTLLTDPDFEAVFRSSPIEEDLVAALCDAPDTNADLMTMNVAMSTATELTHLANGNDDLAAGSRLTSERSCVLVKECLERMPGLRENMEGLLSAVDPEVVDEKRSTRWATFCSKWGYGLEHKDAIKNKVKPLLTR